MSSPSGWRLSARTLGTQAGTPSEPRQDVRGPTIAGSPARAGGTGFDASCARSFGSGIPPARDDR